MPLGGSSTHGFSSKSRIPCQSLTASHPGDGIRPRLVLPACRRGATPAICSAIEPWSAIVTFSDGATKPRIACRAAWIECARINATAAPTERSSTVSAVQASVATCPGGVIAAAPKPSAGITGPCRLQRSVSRTGSAPRTAITASRVSNRRQPSGVRYSSGFSGFSRSMKTSWSSR